MAAIDDMELLREYAARGSEEAFAKLVERHINLVYSVALRHVHNPHQAQEISQAVFVILARKAGSLSPKTVLSGWLYKTAWTSAANFMRTETRRIHREQEVYMQSLTTEPEPADWEQIAPALDAAIGGLSEQDRNAVVLRFVENKNFQEVGVALGASEDAAKMRVHRALEKLRKIFTRKGVVLSSTALAGLISANAVQAAPAGVAASVTATAVQGAVLSATTLTLVKGATEIMAWTTKVKIAAGVAVAALIACGSYQIVGQQQEVTTLQRQLEQEQQAAQQQAAAQQTALAELKKEKQALLEERHREDEVTAKLLAKQRAETDTAVAKANAATARADQLTRDAQFNALGAFMNDPANREMNRLNFRENVKGRYADFIKRMKLSPEDADKFIDMLTVNETRTQDRVGAMWQKTMDVTTALAARDNDHTQLKDQIRSWLGDDAEKQYEDVQRNVNADDAVGALNRELRDNPLSDDQAKRLRELIRTEPEIPISVEDFFRPGASADELFQQIADRSQNILKAAAAFLTPEQLAAAATIASKNIDLMRKQMELAKQLFRNSASGGN